MYTFIEDLTGLVEEIPTDSIVSRTVHNDASCKGVLFGFAPGQELSEHTASMPAVIHIVSGEGRITLGDKSYDVSAGSWLHMPPQLPHSVIADSPLLMILLLLKGQST